MVIVDASVLIADLRPSEPHHTEARALLIRLSRERIRVCFPTIVLSEVAAGVSRATGRVALAQRTVRNLRRERRYQFVTTDDELVDRAADIAAQFQVRGCDAIYIALAEARGLPLITLDQEQRDRSPASVVAYSPSDALRRMRR